jgi:hypothetical protein
LQWGDAVVLLGMVGCLSLGVVLAVHTPPALRGPDISLDPHVLPYYAGLSIVRMAAAYLLSLLFALWYGRAAAYNYRVEKVLLPLLDVLQSVPILSIDYSVKWASATALKAFQRAQGLQVTPAVTPEVVARLRAAVSAAN